MTTLNRMNGLENLEDWQVEESLRQETTCRGCGGSKAKELLCCWNCWHCASDGFKEHDDIPALKYFKAPSLRDNGQRETASTADWLRELDRLGLPQHAKAENFTLRNDPPKSKHKRGEFHRNENTLQKVLINGLDCLPGQQDLF